MAPSLDSKPHHDQLVEDLESSLDNCQILISLIDNHVSHLRRDDADTLTLRGKAKVVWKDNNIQDYNNHLHHQTTALNLLLTALNWSGFLMRSRLSA